MTLDRTRLPEGWRDEGVERLTLADGRQLAYSGWGDPDGFPVFYFHGTPSSRLEAVFADPAARRHGFRLIAIDRPGFGRSTFQDLVACGVFIDPERLKFIAALAPWGPIADRDVERDLNRLDRWYASVARRAPWMMRAAFAPLAWSAEYGQSFFFSVMKSSVCPADRRVMEDETFAGIFQAVQREAFRQGGRGAAHEALIAYRDWGFDLAEIRSPTHVWLGDRDRFVPVQMGRHMQRTIPGVRFHWAVNKGHFMIEHWDDLFAACRSGMEQDR